MKRRSVMALRIKAITLWRRELENKPGALARTLEPLASAGADLKVVMGYRQPGGEETAVVELYPVSGKRVTAAARAAGLTAASIPALLVEGDNRAGTAHAATRALADAGINLNFLLAQVIGNRYSAVLGFESDGDARRAASLIKKVRPPRKR
jgi:hypothetical protein